MASVKAGRTSHRRHDCDRPAMGDAVSHPRHATDAKKLQCDRCENVHSCKCVRDILHETRARATELAGYNQLLATDCGTAHRRVVALEAALVSARRFQNPDNVRLQQQLADAENARRLQAAEFARIKQRLCGSETERGMQFADIAALKLQLRESENARLAAVRRVEELQRTHNIALRQGAGARTSAQTAQAAINADRARVQNLLEQIRADAEELGDENQLLATDSGAARNRIIGLQAALQTSRRLRASDIAQLKQQLRESETARIVAVRRAEELQHAENAAIRRSFAANSALDVERPRVEKILHETRAHVAEMEEEIGALVADGEAARRKIGELEGTLMAARRAHNVEVIRLQRQLAECNSARVAAVQRPQQFRETHDVALRHGADARAAAHTAQTAINAERPHVQNLLEQTRADAEELADENQLLATDSAAARNRIIGLQAALESTRRLREAEIAQLKRQLHERESARIVAVRRAEELQRARNDTHHRSVAANAALGAERPRVENILDETRAHTDEMEDEIDVLATDREAAHRRIVQLERQLAESNSARVAAVLRAQQLQAHNVAHRRNIDARAAAQTAINMEGPHVQNMLDQTRATVDELAVDNDSLAADAESLHRRVVELETAVEANRRAGNSEILALRQQLRECENARLSTLRQLEQLRNAHNIVLHQTAGARAAADAELSATRSSIETSLDETRADADELGEENNALALDFDRQIADINVLRLQLRESENARHVALRRVEELQRRHNETRAAADMHAADITALRQRLHELENARLAAVRRVEELQRSHNEARAGANMQIADTAALRQRLRESENARILAVRRVQELQRSHSETRAGTDELEEENDALTTDREMQIGDITALRQQLHESENARFVALRRVEELERRHYETREDADELEEENDTLATDRDVQIADINELRLQLRDSENARLVALRRVEELQRRHNEMLANAGMQTADNSALRQRLHESENARLAAVRRVEELQGIHDEARAAAGMHIADTTALRQRLRESENASLLAARRIEELELRHDETRGDADELEEENDTLATDRDAQVADITALGMQLRESENARLVALGRIQELERRNNASRANADMQAADNTALRQRLQECENARLVAVRRVEELQQHHDETRGDAGELEEENDVLAADYDMQIADITALRQRLHESENARLGALRRVEELERRHNETRANTDIQAADITALRQRLHESENARLVAVRRVQDLEQRHDETRGDADELEEENETLATDRDVQIGDITALSMQLREAENARLVALGRIEELQRRHNESRANADMQAADNTALRQRLHESENARLVAVGRVQELEQSHDETRGDADELEEENDALAADYDMQIADITALEQRLHESENARLVALRRVEELQRSHDEACAHADEVEEDNDALAADCVIAHRRLAELQQTLLSTQHSQNANIVQLQQRWTESENARRLQVTEIVQLKRQLCDSNTARIVAMQRAEGLQKSQNLALRQTAAIRVAAEAAINAVRTKVQNLQQANAALNVRCGAFMQQQARLIASLASVAHELDVARGHARAMKRMAKMLSSMPPKQAVAAVRAARAEAREARIRERSLAFAKRALELANRAERHRIEYERAFREEATRSLAAKAKDADAALNELRAEYRVVVGECATLRRRFADARDDAKDARARARQLEKTNSSLATQLGAAGEAAHAASVELAIAERTAAQSRGLAAKVARLRARCGELAAVNANANETDIEEEDTSEEGTVCVICLDILAEGESVVRLNCMHVFHSDCILQCLSRMRVPSCPLDRIPVTVELDRLPVSTWSLDGSPTSERSVETTMVAEEA